MSSFLTSFAESFPSSVSRSFALPFNASDGATLVYDRIGTGSPVVLVHGLATDSERNWHEPGITSSLVEAGRQVIAYDARGHGRSVTPVSPNDDTPQRRVGSNSLVGDLRSLLDHLGTVGVEVDGIAVVGYNMGAAVAADAALNDRRIGALALGGTGVEIAEPRDSESDLAMAAALLADDPAEIEDLGRRLFRQYVDSAAGDRHTLAGIIKEGIPSSIPVDELSIPVLVVCGRSDNVAETPDALAARIAGARYVEVDGDHLAAVSEPAFAQALVSFL